MVTCCLDFRLAEDEIQRRTLESKKNKKTVNVSYDPLRCHRCLLSEGGCKHGAKHAVLLGEIINNERLLDHRFRVENKYVNRGTLGVL